MYHPWGVIVDRMNNWLATAIVCPSRANKELLEKYENVPSDKIQPIYHGINMDSFGINRPTVSGLTLPLGRSPIIGIISRYVMGKGIAHAIEAFGQFQESHDKALLYISKSEGANSIEIKGLLDNLSVGSFIEQDYSVDVRDVYDAIDIYVHVPEDPYFESFGLTYIESLAAGVPSIFTISGISGELVEDHYNALVVGHKDPGAIAKALDEIWSDDRLRDNLAANGRNTVSGRFATGQMVREYLNYYNKLLND